MGYHVIACACELRLVSALGQEHGQPLAGQHLQEQAAEAIVGGSAEGAHGH